MQHPELNYCKTTPKANHPRGQSSGFSTLFHIFRAFRTCRENHALRRSADSDILLSGAFPETPTPTTCWKAFSYTWKAYTAVQMGGVLQYNWKACCGVSLTSRLRSQEGTTHCCTNWRCTAVLSDKLCGLGVPKHFPYWA